MYIGLWRSAAAVTCLLLVGCNTLDRPQIVSQPNSDDEVVALPGGGALILRAAAARREEPQCWVRARGFHGLMPMSCDLAERVRP